MYVCAYRCYHNLHTITFLYSMMIVQTWEVKHCEVLLYVRYKLMVTNGVIYITVFRHKFCLLCTHCTVGQSKASIYCMTSAVYLLSASCFSKYVRSLGLYILSYRLPYIPYCMYYI